MYVQKNEDGRIVGLYANAQFEGQEFIDGAELWTDPEQLTRAQIAEKLGYRRVARRRATHR